jgi:hypothetical protein
MEKLKTWYQTSVGQACAQRLLGECHALLDSAYGYYALQIGLATPNWLTAATHIRHHFCLSQESTTSFQASFTELPLQTENIDLLILNHVLEFQEDPTNLLEAALHSLIPNGYLLICSVEKASWFAKVCSSWQRHNQAKHKNKLLKKKLEPLALEVIASHEFKTGAYFAPKFYVHCLQKRTIPLTPISLEWNASRLKASSTSVNPLPVSH